MSNVTVGRENGDNIDISRRGFLLKTAGLAAIAGLPLAGNAAAANPPASQTKTKDEKAKGGTITTKDGTQIYYKDWGTGQPIVFSHGWPLSADDWDAQMLFFLKQGYRVIAHDRRGHGRSSQVSDGHDMDHYADDLAALTEHLDLKNAVHVGHSTGGGEVVHYLGRHGQSRVAKAALISAVPPLMVKTPGQVLLRPAGRPVLWLQPPRRENDRA